MKKERIRIVVAMSGGVDSSVSAVLLKNAGFDVVGIMMKFWSDKSPSGNLTDKKDTNRCCSVESEKLARLVAKQIGIPFYVVNVEKEFKKKVVDYFLKEYKKGKTPNPCVVCNKEIKFGFLIKKALSLGADFVATGHYAQVSTSRSATNFYAQQRNFFSSRPVHRRFPSPQKKLLPRLSSFGLLKSKDTKKDQSYFLWQLDQKQLSHVLFPVGGYAKTEVRALAKKFKLPTAETLESQEVCFVQDTTNNFLKKYLKQKPGNIADKTGKVLGKHNGLWFYTIGQRKGIEIQQGPWFVVGKDFKKNILIISKNKKDLEKKELIASNVNWILSKNLPINAEVKIRYKSNLAKAKIIKLNDKKIKIIFNKSQRAITPGQSVVFYKGQELIGGGVIE